MHEHRIRSGSAELFVVVRGSGPPVVLLHGALGDAAEIDAALGRLPEHFTIITPDVRGRGRSLGRDPEEHTLEQYADDVAVVLDHLGYESAAVGGGSLGSLVSIKTALRHPDRVEALVLIGPPFAPGHELTVEQRDLFGLFVSLSATIETEGLEVAAGGLEGSAAELAAALRRHDGPSLAAWMRKPLWLLNPVAALAELASVAAPALIVPGFDPIHPPHIADLYAGALPNAVVADVVRRRGSSAGLPDLPEILAVLQRVMERDVSPFLARHLRGTVAPR